MIYPFKIQIKNKKRFCNPLKIREKESYKFTVTQSFSIDRSHQGANPEIHPIVEAPPYIHTRCADACCIKTVRRRVLTIFLKFKQTHNVYSSLFYSLYFSLLFSLNTPRGQKYSSLFFSRLTQTQILKCLVWFP